MNVILSTCGTSILTNSNPSKEVQAALTRHSNVKKAEDIPMLDKQNIEEHINKILADFLNDTLINAQAKSSELNGVLTYYDNNFVNAKGDLHYLLVTDTWLGQVTAKVIKQWLEKYNIKVQLYSHNDLQTADWNRFSSSLSDLVIWCHDTIGPLRSAYHIVFNLSGGFKSETGFMQVLGMFYADEMVYIFERSRELMRIPKLPIKMEDEPWVCEDLHDIRRASIGLSVGKKSGIYWFTIDNESSLTPWGELVFKRHQDEIYKKEILPSITKQVVFNNNFIDSCKNETPEHIREVNKKIDLLALKQESSVNLRSLDFKQLKGTPMSGSTHELDTWADGNPKRIFCSVKNCTIFLNKLDNALH
jgi:putative CRISPR-associated protein (TIGR02619 family)